jgi:hypothetical protein
VWLYSFYRLPASGLLALLVYGCGIQGMLDTMLYVVLRWSCLWVVFAGCQVLEAQEGNICGLWAACGSSLLISPLLSRRFSG